MNRFEEYMKMNVYYEYLCKYYKSEDIATIYGVDKLEIKHSNVLKWILEPKNEDAIQYLPIRNLLKLIQSKNKYHDFFNTIDLNVSSIKDVKVQREKNNIDLLITFKLNEISYAIIIENKLESLIHDNQLEVYKERINRLYPSHKKLYAFLHPGYHINAEQETIVDEAQYISVTYQEIYDEILKMLVEFTNDSTVKFIVSYYIHTLCCYDTNNIFGLIITGEEKTALHSLLKDDEILKMIDSLYNNEKNEYTEYYKEHKSNFIRVFSKSLHLIQNESLQNKLLKILNTKSYIMNNHSYKSIADLLVTMFTELIQNNSLNDLHEITHLLSETDPLMILEQDLEKVEHSNWYLSNPKIIMHNANKYYVLSAWTSKEYDELKDKVNHLSKTSPNIYGSISME